MIVETSYTTYSIAAVLPIKPRADGPQLTCICILHFASLPCSLVFKVDGVP